MLIAHAALQCCQHEGDYRDDITATVLWLAEILVHTFFKRGTRPDVYS